MYKKNKVNKILFTFYFIFLFFIFYCINPIQNFEENSLPTDYEIQENDIQVEITEIEKVSSFKEEDTTLYVEETTTAPNKKKEEIITRKEIKNFGYFKSYTDYRCLSRSSPQWKLQEQAYTDENGLRKIEDAYLVALGSYYGKELGTKYVVTLSTGNQFYIILCDQKDNRHTNETHQYTVSNNCVIEFYVETEKLPSSVRKMGSVGVLEKFSGNIISIEKTAE